MNTYVVTSVTNELNFAETERAFIAWLVFSDRQHAVFMMALLTITHIKAISALTQLEGEPRCVTSCGQCSVRSPSQRSSPSVQLRSPRRMPRPKASMVTAAMRRTVTACVTASGTSGRTATTSATIATGTTTTVGASAGTITTSTIGTATTIATGVGTATIGTAT